MDYLRLGKGDAGWHILPPYLIQSTLSKYAGSSAHTLQGPCTRYSIVRYEWNDLAPRVDAHVHVHVHCASWIVHQGVNVLAPSSTWLIRILK